MRSAAALALALLAAATPLGAQSLEVRAESRGGTVGDVLTFLATVRLEPGQELLDQAPRSLLPPPEGVKILSIDPLRPARGGKLQGRIRMAFYRLGEQPVPTLALFYRPRPGAPPDTLIQFPVKVVIEPTLPPGDHPLTDIKPLAAAGGPVALPLAILLAIIAAGGWWLWRRGRGTLPAARARPAAEPALAPGPFEHALARLAELERELAASGNGVVPCYAAVTVVLRDCLIQTGAVPARGLTTPEIGPRLPRRLAHGDLRGRCERILGDADLVKFARVRPDHAAAAEHLRAAQGLVRAWRLAAAPPAGETA